MNGSWLILETIYFISDGIKKAHLKEKFITLNIKVYN